MDIYAEIKSFSFYENSGTVFINAKIIEKRLSQLPHPSKTKFEEAEVGELITLKIDRERIKEEKQTSLEEIVSLLQNRFLVLNITGWEPALQGFNNKSSPKFLLSTARKTCGILLER